MQSPLYFWQKIQVENSVTLNTGTSTTTFIGLNGTHKVIMGFACEYSPVNTPPPFAHYFESKVGRELILEYSVNLDYTPPQMHGCTEITW